MKQIFSILLVLTSSSVFADSKPAEVHVEKADGSGSSFASSLNFGGPSLHFGVGVKTKKSPLQDEFYSAYAGIRASVFSMGFGDQVYASLLGLGVNLQRDALFALSFTPIAIYYKYGVGIGLDLFSVSDRDDRPGGAIGVVLTADLIRLASMFAPK